ncbi:S1C family serine protease [Bradyrhizobium sp. USDA 3240]
MRISASGLTAARIGRSIDAEPGDFVVAVSGSSRFTQSISFGIVSALHRSLPGIPCQDLIQTDALLDRGSAGGPLFNLRGEVIGIVAATTVETESERAFAIPSDAIDRLYIRMNLGIPRDRGSFRSATDLTTEWWLLDDRAPGSVDHGRCFQQVIVHSNDTGDCFGGNPDRRALCGGWRISHRSTTPF